MAAILTDLQKTVIAGLAGVLVFRDRRRFSRTLDEWRQARESRLRF